MVVNTTKQFVKTANYTEAVQYTSVTGLLQLFFCCVYYNIFCCLRMIK